MICKVYRHWRTVKGKRVRDRVYTGHLRIDGDDKISYIRLNTADKVVAEKKLDAIRSERERERIGILPPKALRTAADLPITEHLKAYLADLKANDNAKGYVKSVEHRIRVLLRQCEWSYLRDINADRFVTWRSVQPYAAKTLNDYLNALCALLNWLGRMERMISNPLKHVSKLETQGKERRKRRSFSEEDLAKLVTVAPIDLCITG